MFEQYKNSNSSLYVVISAVAYDADDMAKAISSTPRYIKEGKYVILSMNKDEVQTYYDYAIGLGYAPIYEFIEDVGQPMLLTWAAITELLKEEPTENE